MRPSRHPIVVRYCESETIKQAMEEAADRSGSTFAEIQRRVNRAGLQSLGLLAAQ